MASQTPPTYLRPAEVAALFRVSPKTVNTWGRKGILPSIRTLGGQRRYEEATVREIATRRGYPMP